MGLPGGWVTGVPGPSLNEQLKLLGNGVVPQQAVAALRLLLPWALPLLPPAPPAEPAPVLPVKFLDEPQPCVKCGLPTVTRKVGKGARQPMHVSCDNRPNGELSSTQLVDVLANLANALGPVRVVGPPPPQPEDIGPCLRCQRPTRRYGTAGRPFCHHCDEESPRMFTQLELWPVGVCDCGHLIPGAEQDEPCPVCLEDNHHDCPLQLQPETEQQ